MTYRSNPLPAVTSLRPGESLQTTLRAGTQVLVVKGEVLLSEPPLWLADTVVPVRTALAEGAGHRVSATGCVTLSAPGDAEVHCWEPATPWELAAGWLMSRAQLFLVRFGFAHRG